MAIGGETRETAWAMGQAGAEMVGKGLWRKVALGQPSAGEGSASWWLGSLGLGGIRRRRGNPAGEGGWRALADGILQIARGTSEGSCMAAAMDVNHLADLALGLGEIIRRGDGIGAASWRSTVAGEGGATARADAGAMHVAMGSHNGFGLADKLRMAAQRPDLSNGGNHFS